MEDEYVAKYVKAIKDNIGCEEDIAKIINAIYEDGFTDGFHEGKQESRK